MTLNLLVALLLPRPLNHCVNVIAQRPLSCFLTGMLICLLLGPLTFLLAVSVVGARAVPLMAVVIVGALILGKLAVYRYAGEQLADQLGADFLNHNLWSLLVGLALFSLLYLVPILGLVVLGLVVMMGLGTAVLSGFLAFKSESPEPATLGIPLVVESGQPTGSPPSLSGPAAVEAILLDRAGFWIRLLASLIDFLLVCVVLRGLLGREAMDLLVPVFVLYHLGMWVLKGTTIGGLVAGLRIVQLDGESLTLSGALVRWLAAFLSALVLGLGFFWAGWNREKQSWHDLLAGTVIVKMPRGLVTRLRPSVAEPDL